MTEFADIAAAVGAPLQSLPFVIVGAGGHGSVVAGLLLNSRLSVLGVTDASAAPAVAQLLGIPILGDDSVLATLGADRIWLANGIGIAPRLAPGENADPGTTIRRRVFVKLRAAGFVFPAITHASAVISSAVEIGAGAQVMAGAVLQPRAMLGENVVINSAASVDHDCIIGDHAFVAPGAVLCGAVRVGESALIGAGAIILPGVSIGANAIVAAGACIRRDVQAGECCF